MLSRRRRTTRARSWILDEACRQAARIAGNVVDHIAGLERSLTGDPFLAYSPMTLGRAALDGAVRVCYLLDTAVSLDDRLLRGAALLMDSCGEELAAVRALPPGQPPMPGALDVVTRMRDNVAGWVATAGIETRQGRGGRVSGLSWGSAAKAVPLKVNVTSEAERYFPEVPAAYRMSSGVAHSMPWMLHDNDDLPSIIYMTGATVLTCLNGCIKIAEVFAKYYGHDPSAGTKSGLLRCQAVTIAMHDYGRAGHNSVGRYKDDPRLQSPPARRES